MCLVGWNKFQILKTKNIKISKLKSMVFHSNRLKMAGSLAFFLWPMRIMNTYLYIFFESFCSAFYPFDRACWFCCCCCCCCRSHSRCLFIFMARFWFEYHCRIEESIVGDPLAGKRRLAERKKLKKKNVRATLYKRRMQSYRCWRVVSKELHKAPANNMEGRPGRQ